MPAKILNIENFETLRKENGYYVDKTGFLEKFLEDPADASLFTRPRRFGKTLLMSMLASFFDITKDSRDLFAGLKIAENEELCKEWMNQYPVIFLTLKGIENPTFERALAHIHDQIRTFCRQHKYLLTSELVYDTDKDSIRHYLDSMTDEDTLELALQVLTRSLFCHYGKRAIVLVDDYDAPLAEAAERGYYQEMMRFMRCFLGNVLKTNFDLEFGILTGVLRITEDSLNNLDCFDISTFSYSDSFGFTQEEVDRLLTDSDFEDKLNTIQTWYGGYHFGKPQELYCPWSIMNHLVALGANPQESPNAYWDGLTPNGLTGGFLERIPSTIQDDIASLTEGKTIAAEINEDLNYDQVYTEEDNFWTLLYLTGYLTPSSDSANCVVSPGPG